MNTCTPLESPPKEVTTPLLKEIQNLVNLYPGESFNLSRLDHLVLVQVGSFYELYEMASKSHDFNEIVQLLNLRIAKKKMRNEVVKFAGFPVVKAKEYIELLMRNNITVAMADQTGKDVASKTKLFVRNVTRIITPGTVLADDDFSAENTFLLCVEFPDFTDSEWKSKTLGLSWVDVSTGEFYLSESKVILNLMI